MAAVSWSTESNYSSNIEFFCRKHGGCSPNGSELTIKEVSHQYHFFFFGMERKWFFDNSIISLSLSCSIFFLILPYNTQTDIAFHFYLFDFTFTLSYFGLQRTLFLRLLPYFSQLYFSSHYLTNYKLFSNRY